MVLEEVFENGVSLVKTVWQKRGDAVTRREIKRMIATDVTPSQTKDHSNGS